MEKWFRKEYLPAILIYVLSAALFIAAAVMFFVKNIHWATFLLLGIVVMLVASSQLVKIGKRLREEDEREQND